MVVADPKPGAPSGGIFLNRLAFLSTSTSAASVTPCDMDGNEALVLNCFTESEDLGALLDAEALEGCALAKVTRFGDAVAEGADELAIMVGCQRSSTDDFRGLRGFVGGLGGVTTGLSNRELILTMLWTKPRPCNLLILGLGSFGAGDFINAGDGTTEEGIIAG